MAGNTITNILPKILARGLITLREQCTYAHVVNMDYGTEARQKGQTVDVPIPSATSAYDITPAPTHSSAPGVTPGLVQITLNQWKGASFALTDKEMGEIDRNRHFVPMAMQEAVKALANAVNTQVASNYLGIYGHTGTLGTTPFSTSVTCAVQARKVLHRQLAPRTDRRAVVDFDCEANMLALPQFSDADKIGTPDIRVEGEVGRKYGIDWYTDDAVPTHVVGTSWDNTPGMAIASDIAAGLSYVDLHVGSGTGTIALGDVFSIAGQTQQYVITAAQTTASSWTNVPISPPLQSIATNLAAVTGTATHVVNMAFHRDCFALATRPLQGVLATNPNIMSMTDPVSGLSLRLELIRLNKQDKWELDILWGSKLVRAALGTRILNQ